jgi:hypothetical protein
MFRSVRTGHTNGRHHTYAYSFDRETFTGAFATRDEAYRAAVARASGMEDTPAEIFVGERVPADPQASGHATELIKAMARRARAAAGEGADEYLRRVNDQQEAELDEAVECTILDWLTRHEMMPTFADVRAISEHPMPALTGAPEAGLVKSRSDEVSDLGTTEYPLPR